MKKTPESLLKDKIDDGWKDLSSYLGDLSFNDSFSFMITMNARYLNVVWDCVKTEGKKEISNAIKYEYNKMLEEKLR